MFDCVSCLCLSILSHWCPINILVCICVSQIPSEIRSTCLDALHWARRFLPFSCFLNAEEILQDILLSLVSELPPLSLVIWPFLASTVTQNDLEGLILHFSLPPVVPLLRWQTHSYEPSQRRRSLSESHWEKSITRWWRDWGNATFLVQTPEKTLSHLFYLTYLWLSWWLHFSLLIFFFGIDRVMKSLGIFLFIKGQM